MSLGVDFLDALAVSPRSQTRYRPCVEGEMRMTEITYDGAGHIVRGDHLQAQRRAWTQIASAGNWRTGAERLTIAAKAHNVAG